MFCKNKKVEHDRLFLWASDQYDRVSEWLHVCWFSRKAQQQIVDIPMGTSLPKSYHSVDNLSDTCQTQEDN